MEERHGWVLATFLQRLAAYAIDKVFSGLPLAVFVIALVFSLIIVLSDDTLSLVDNSGTLIIVLSDDTEPLVDNSGTIVWVLVAVSLGSLAVFVGYVVWWLFTLRRGQTPGKQMVGIRVIKNNGELSDWSYTFLRELVIKGLVGGFLSGMTGGIYWVVDHLWPLFDSDRQALHDKMVDTLVVQDRR